MSDDWKKKFDKELAATKAEMDTVFDDLGTDLKAIGKETETSLEAVREELHAAHERRMTGISAIGNAGKVLEVLDKKDPMAIFEGVGGTTHAVRAAAEPVGTFTGKLQEKSLIKIRDAIDGRAPQEPSRSR